MDAGKAGLGHDRKSDLVKAIKRENDDLKRIIGEMTIVNDG